MSTKKTFNKNILIICFSILCCVSFIILFVLFFNNKAVCEMQSFRINCVNHYINNIANNEFPDFYSTRNNDHAYGIYLVASYLGYFMNLDGENIFRLLSIILFILLVVTIPFYIHRKTKNVICSCISPFLLCLFYYNYIIKTKCDVYIVLSVCVVFWGIPILEKVIQEKNAKKKNLWYILLIFLVSITNIARLHISLGLMLIVAFQLILDAWNSIKKHDTLNLVIELFLLFLLIYLNDFCASSLPEILLKLHNQPMLNLTNTSWHNILIGFGTFENPYNLYYNDTCAWEIVQSLDSTIQYASNEYYLKCKELVFDLLRTDTWFCLISLIKKTFLTIMAILYATVKWTSTLLFLALFFVFWHKNRKIYTIQNYFHDEKNILFYAIIIAIIGSFFSILTTPSIYYSFTSVSALYFCIFKFILIFISKYTDYKKLETNRS